MPMVAGELLLLCANAPGAGANAPVAGAIAPATARRVAASLRKMYEGYATEWVMVPL
jgi:hypothetical protein